MRNVGSAFGIVDGFELCQEELQSFILARVLEAFDILKQYYLRDRFANNPQVGAQRVRPRVAEAQGVTARPVASFGEWLAGWATTDQIHVAFSGNREIKKLSRRDVEDASTDGRPTRTALQQ